MAHVAMRTTSKAPMKVTANGIQIEVEDTGSRGDGKPVVLLIMGLGMQLIGWPPGLVNGLADAGFRVVRFDNRDIGLSQFFDHLGKPPVAWLMLKKKLGFSIKPGYTLADMAKDSIGVLDALEIQRAHVVGASMGGMIAQRVAVMAPQRCASLVSIMSTSGAPNLPGPKASLLRAMLSRPTGKGHEALEAHYMRLLALLSGPGFEVDEPTRRAAIRYGLKRSDHAVGTLRQMLAVGADTNRHLALASIQVPSLVLHGTADPLIPIACGQDSAKRIPNARFEAIEGWGHDMPPGVLPLLTQHIVAHARTHAGVRSQA